MQAEAERFLLSLVSLANRSGCQTHQNREICAVAASGAAAHSAPNERGLNRAKDRTLCNSASFVDAFGNVLKRAAASIEPEKTREKNREDNDYQQSAYDDTK